MVLMSIALISAASVALYIWLILPRLRRRPGWAGIIAEVGAALAAAFARLRALCGNSRTLAVAYAAELLGVLDEAKLLDWSELLGAESAGRVMVVMGAVMILLRLVTRTAVSFKTEA
ncbi:MAG TPA: hypothetical protein VE801_14840 [Xanthobacteraceae bacterium]|nr:hypothetical protein [Xanthobacteraceae bacterium]